MLQTNHVNLKNTVHFPFSDPSMQLIQSSTSAAVCNGRTNGSNQCQVVYNLNRYDTICPHDKTFESCVQTNKAQDIFAFVSSQPLSVQTDLVNFADEVQLCTPQMKTLLESQSDSSSSIISTSSKILFNTCQFTPK